MEFHRAPDFQTNPKMAWRHWLHDFARTIAATNLKSVAKSQVHGDPLSINPRFWTRPISISTSFAGKWTINGQILGTTNWRILTHLTNVWLPSFPGAWSCSPKHCRTGCRHMQTQRKYTRNQTWSCYSKESMSTCHPCEETYFQTITKGMTEHGYLLATWTHAVKSSALHLAQV